MNQRNREDKKPNQVHDITLRTNPIKEIDLNSEINLKTNQFNLIQTFLMIATAIMLLPAVAIIESVGRTPANLIGAVSLIMQILTICAILFACILLSKIEGKLNYVGGK